MGTASDNPPSPAGYTAVITCYNYRAFIAEALDSVLAQRTPPTEIVVVDDGSQDDSVAFVEQCYGSVPGLRVLRKANGGAATAIAAGVAAATGDWIAFLDADDIWEPDFLARVSDVRQTHPKVDYVYANMRYFGRREGLYLRDTRSRDCGVSILRGAYRPVWQSSASSAITLRASLAKRLFASVPQAMLEAMRPHNDDFLCLGANIMGARKYYLAEPLVRYRAHGSNVYLDRRPDEAQRLLHWFNVQRIVEHYCRQFGLEPSRRADHLCFTKHEFRSKPAPDAAELLAYCRLVLQSALPWHKSALQCLSMLRHWLGASR